MNYTKESALKRLKQLRESVREEGPEDTIAWEYLADLERATLNIENGSDPDIEMSNV